MSSTLLAPPRPFTSRRRRGVALITTVVAAAAAASIVLVMVHLSLSDLRSAAAAEETAEARSKASAAIADIATELAVEPSSWAENVNIRERARVCVALPAQPVVQPGAKWPAECGATWTYVDPVLEADARVEITPPSPASRELVVSAVGRSNDTLAGRAATFVQPTAASWTMLSFGALSVDKVERIAGEPYPVKGAAVYATDTVELADTSSAALDRSVVVSETAVTGFATAPLDPAEPEIVGPVPDSNRLYGPNPTTNIADVRDLLPSPITLGQLRASTEIARLTTCRGTDARNVTVGGHERVSQMCLNRSARLQTATGSTVRVPSDTEAYLLVTRTVAGDSRVAVYTSATLPAPNTAGDLRTGATAAQVSAGTHPGVASAAIWRPLGEFHLPATGIVATDRDVYLGACGTGFLSSGGSCDTQAGSDATGMAVAEPFTVIAGTDAQPRDAYIGSPIHNRGGLLGVASFGRVNVAYWARPAGANLELDIAAAALGSDDGTPGFRQFPPLTAATGANLGGRLTVTGSIADTLIDLSGMTQFSETVVQPSSSQPPAHFPATRRAWIDSADRPAALTEVCGSPSCPGWLGGDGTTGGSGDNTPPAVPHNVTVVAASSAATVTWPAVPDAAVYRVLWTRASGGTEQAIDVAAAACSSTCSGSLAGLTNGVRYNVQVDAADSDGNTSARSAVVSFVPDGLPGVPTDVVATASGPARVQVEWNRATTGPQPTGFRVYRDGVLVAQTVAQSWVDSAAQSGATHTYQVRAINDAGQSALSAGFTVLVMPGRPVALTAAGATNQINLSWTTTSGTVTGYKIYRATSSVWPGPAGLVTTVASPAVTRLDTGLSNGTRYWYWVTSYNASGESPPAKADAVTLPAAVTGFTPAAVEGVGGRLTFSWTPLTGQEVTGYRVYTNTGTLIGTSATSPLVVDGISAATTVYYNVRAYNATGEGLASSNAFARPVPNTPTSISMATSTLSYSGSYTAATGATTYQLQIQRRTTAGTEVIHLDSSSAATTFSANPGLYSTQYQARVRSTNGSGNSAWSAWTAWTAYTTPSTPTMSGYLSGNDYVWTWNAPAGAVTYNFDHMIHDIYSWGGGGVENTAATSKVRGGRRGFSERGRVAACNSNGCSGVSNDVLIDYNVAPAYGAIRLGLFPLYNCGGPFGCELNGAGVMYDGYQSGWSQAYGGGYGEFWGSRSYGWVRFPHYGCYAFHLSTDDSHRLLISNGAWGGNANMYGWQFDRWQPYQPAATTTGCVWVNPGYELYVVLDHLEALGDASVYFYWSGSMTYGSYGWQGIDWTWTRQ